MKFGHHATFGMWRLVGSNPTAPTIKRKPMWEFVDSIMECSVEYCKEEVILYETLSGRRLCRKHAELQPDAVQQARAFLSHHWHRSEDRFGY